MKTCVPLSNLSRSSLLLLFIALCIASSTTMFRVPTRTKPQLRCVLYDRPPRTGSTTISSALRRCLRSKNFSETPKLRGMPQGQRRAMYIQHMLNNVKRSRAMLTRHVYISQRDIDKLVSRCTYLLYITSCAPLKSRLQSAMKHMIAGGHGNVTINGSLGVAHHEDVTIPPGSLRSRYELVNYPYLSADHQGQRIARPLSPNYVIRRTHLQSDLAHLLTALGCRPSFTSENVHDSAEENEQMANHTCARCNDKLFERLSRHAERNNGRGLRMARNLGDQRISNSKGTFWYKARRYLWYRR